MLITVPGCSDKNTVSKNNRSGYVQVTNGKLFYQQFGSGGTPIVVLHGGPGLDQSYLLPQLLTLAKNHTLIFYDQRGSGKSLQTPLNSAYINMQQFVEDLDKLRQQLGLNKFILLGHSWGGFLAMNYAVRYPQHIAALILMNTAPADYRGQRAFAEQFTKRAAPIKSEIMPLFNYQAFEKLTSSQITQLYRKVFSIYFYDAAQVKKLTLNMNTASASSGVKVMAIMSKTDWITPNINLFPQLKNFSAPTLVIYGEQDIVPIWTARTLKTALPNAHLAIIKNCGHFPFIEQPTELFAQINQFTAQF